MSTFLDNCPDKLRYTINKIRTLINNSIYEGHVFVVGGVVRDVLLGDIKEDFDIDIAVDIPDGGTSFAVWLTYHTGCHYQYKNPCMFETYGTAKLQILSDKYISDIQIECVQTRKEKYNKNSRNPSTCYGSIEEDAMRRDLTINALYYNITQDKICDFTKMGLSDLENHIIRTTGDANAIFDDDPLRIFRVIRFANRLGWPIEKKTWIGMISNSKKISTLTLERINDEVGKMLMGPKPSDAIMRMDRCNVLEKIFPFLEMEKHVFQDLNPKKTVYEHTLEVLDKTPHSLDVRIAALFHDIGKLKTYEKGFLFHSQVGADMTEKVLRAMKFSNRTVDVIKKAVEFHEEFSCYKTGIVPRDAVIRKFVAKFNGDDYALNVALDLIHANNISQTYGKKVKLVPGIKAKIKKLDEKNESGKKLTLPINGNDIMKEFSIRKGPVIGGIISEIRNKVIEKPDLSKEEAFKIAEEYLKKVV